MARYEEYTRDEVLEIIVRARGLRGANLRRLDLSGADLNRVNRVAGVDTPLTELNLPGANLAKADLSGADLREANLSLSLIHI